MILPPHSSHKHSLLIAVFWSSPELLWGSCWCMGCSESRSDIWCQQYRRKLAGWIRKSWNHCNCRSSVQSNSRNIFVEADFPPSEVTDQELPEQDPTSGGNEGDRRIIFLWRSYEGVFYKTLPGIHLDWWRCWHCQTQLRHSAGCNNAIISSED